MRTETINIYLFDELSDAAKEKARDNFRYSDTIDNSDNDSTLDSFCSLFDCKYVPYGYLRHNFESEGQLEWLSLHKYIMNNYYKEILKPKQYWITNGRINCVGVNSKTRYSKILVECNCPMTGFYMDDIILSPILEFIKKPRKITFNDLLTECYELWEKAINEEKEHQQSNEYIDSELSELYEFTIDGKIYCNL